MGILECFGRSRRSLLALAIAVGVLGLDSRARAVVDPATCTENGFQFQLGRTPSGGIPLGTITSWSVSAQNGNTPATACSIDKITADFCCPGLDGELATTQCVISNPPQPSDTLKCTNPSDLSTCVATNCCLPMIRPKACTSNVDCTEGEQTCITASGFCGYAGPGAGNTTPTQTGKFFNMMCLTKVNPLVGSAKGGIDATGTIEDSLNGTSGQDLSKSLTNLIVPCTAQVDKQVCCAGNACGGDGDNTNWFDVGFEQSGGGTLTNVTLGCTQILGQPVKVRYVVKNNSSEVDLYSCLLDESDNATIGPDITVGDLAKTLEKTFNQNDPICTAELDAAEPDTATLTCFCTPQLDNQFTVSVNDTATLMCVEPKVAISKTCGDQESDCVTPITVTVQNTGDPGAPGITNCHVVDNVHTNTSVSNGMCTGGDSVIPITLQPAVNNTITVTLGPTDKATLSGSAELLLDSCNEASVVCDVVGFPGVTVTATALPKDCPVPQVDVAINKVCDPQSGGINSIRVTVANTSPDNIDLVNCVVTDNIYLSSPTCPPSGSPTSVSLTPATAPTLVKGNPATIFTGQVSGLAADACNQGTVMSCESKVCSKIKTVTKMSNDPCETFNPRITVQKTCSQVPGDGSITVKVSNTGTEPLQNCSVTDYFFPDTNTCGVTSTSTVPLSPAGSFSLPLNGSATFTGKATGFSSDSCDRATATCTGSNSGQSTSGFDTDICPACSPAFTMDKTCDAAQNIDVHVNNTGKGAITCTVEDELFTNLEQCGTVGSGDDLTLSCTDGTTTFGPTDFDVAEGDTVTCSLNVSNDISSTSCDRATVTCKPKDTSCSTVLEPQSDEAVCPIGGCRVTGGGRLYSLYPDAPCSPDTDPNCMSPEAQDATHGGQVGASVGVTGTDLGPDLLGSPCIKGEWEHVRHIRPRLRGNFHASRFDSLECGCLGCLNSDGFPTCKETSYCDEVSDPGCLDRPLDETCESHALENGLCFHEVDSNQNFKDNRICGPEPRKAPANKICFSGVGDYTFSNGKRDRKSVVFRVDIIDRSEPGGSWPKGSVPPPDRYRMRMWFLCNPAAEDECMSATNDSIQIPWQGDYTAVGLREAVACGDPRTEILPEGTPFPNIDDGGDLDRGNHQLHPPTGAECRQ